MTYIVEEEEVLVRGAKFAIPEEKVNFNGQGRFWAYRVVAFTCRFNQSSQSTLI